MVKKKRSRILDAAHETAKDLHDAGVMDETAMREFNAIRLPPVKQCTAKDIKRIWTHEGAKLRKLPSAYIDVDLLPRFPPWESTVSGALFAP